MKLLITGTAGFIGHALVEKISGKGDAIVGLDNINDYYDVNLKYGRLEDSGIDKKDIRYDSPSRSRSVKDYQFIRLNLEDRKNLFELFEREKFDLVCHLAAQAGVRYSLENPHAYIDSNIVGFMNILEACRHHKLKHLVYASSSSVYGLNRKMPFSTSDNVDHPVSLYAATKKSCELMAHTYSHLYGLPTTGLRFFTVYGPWGRPDMAAFKFVRRILEDEPIEVYNQGRMSRDFTYIDDIVEGVIRVLDKPPAPNPQPPTTSPQPPTPYKIYNIGRGQPVNLMDFIIAIEKALNKKSRKNFLPLQKGDVLETWADTASLEKDTGYKPNTPFEEGIKKFVAWYKDFYKIKM